MPTLGDRRRTFSRTRPGGGLGAAKLSVRLCWVVVACSLSNAICEASRPPNVLLLLVDDLKPLLGSYGDQHVRSPHMDRLAQLGVRFDRAYCNQAVCAPSRNSLMLGSRPTSIGVYSLDVNFRRAVPQAVTMPQHFRRFGYRALSIGKVFHVGHGNVDDTDSWSEPSHPEKVVDYVLSASTDARLTREEARFLNQAAEGLPRGAAWEQADVGDDAYSDGRIATLAIRRLRQCQGRDEPFFMAVGFTKPHLPFCAPLRYWQLYEPLQLPISQHNELPIGAPAYAGKPLGELAQYASIPDAGPLSEDLQRKLVHGYYASVSYVDAQIGRILEALEATKLATNTVIVLWGDHGFHLGDHGLWTKHTNFEQANRIPLIIVAPGVTQGGGCSSQVVETVDIFPTLCDLAKLPPPEGPQPIDGDSVRSALERPHEHHKGYALHCFPRDGQRMGRAIRTDQYRLVEWTVNGHAETVEYELYDYATDPLEVENVAHRWPHVVMDLAATLRRHPIARVPIP